MTASAEPMDTDVAIETPEHIVFRYRLAGPARRMLAHIMDLCICYGVIIVAALAVTLISGGASAVKGAASGVQGLGMGLLLLLAFAAQWVYFVAWEAVKGATPGKMGMGLHVVTTEGRPIGFTEAALRNLLRGADMLPTAYVVGVVSMMFSRKFQRLGDLVAGTVVIIAERARTATPIELVPPAAPEELRELPERVELDADERAAIELFLRARVRGTLGTAREEELADMIAGPLLTRHGVSRRPAGSARALAVLYDRAKHAGREAAPPSSVRR